MTTSQRKIQNLVIRPKFQMRFTFYYMVSGVGVFGAMIVWIFLITRNIRTTILEGGLSINPEAQKAALEHLHQLTTVTLLGCVIFILLSFLYSIFVSHKIAGPIVAIVSYIRALKDGHYDYKRNLRPSDELSEIMLELHDLADELKNKSSKAEAPNQQ